MTTQQTQTDHVPAHRDVQPQTPEGILTVGALRDLLNQLTEQGIRQDTAVVVANDGWYDELSAHVEHPLDRSVNEFLWVTLSPAGPADARFTAGHFVDDEPTPPTTAREPLTDLVGRLFAQFWTGEDATDAALSYKAGDYDACLWVAEQVHVARKDLTWSDAAVRRAADLSYVMGQYGVDQTNDRQYHAAMAVAIFETTEVD